MVTADTRYLSIAESAALLRKGGTTSVELTRSCLDLIEAIDDQLHCFITVTADLALSQAAEADAELAAGVDRGPLHGIPIGLKDLYATKGIATTAHSKVLVDWLPEEDCAAWEALRNAGSVLLGKLAMHEFASAMQGPNLPFPQARNPWKPDYVPGGSSSGSGAALAAGLCFGALGSDTGGSIRNPASLCGIVGLKPTFGRCSRRGVVPLSWSLDHVGPMARTVEDCAILMQPIAGFDPLDPASANVPVPDFSRDLRAGVRGLRLGVPRGWLDVADGTDPEVVAAFEAALDVYRGLGAEVVEVPSEPFIDARAANYLVMLSEAYAYHEENVRARPQDYSRNLLDFLHEGAFVTAADYIQAQRARVAIREAIGKIMADVDVILSPSSPTPAQLFDSQDMGARYRRPNFTNPANTTGFPAISLPCGMSSIGLPIGLQIMGRAWEEGMVLRVAQAYEDATGWSKMHPEI